MAIDSAENWEALTDADRVVWACRYSAEAGESSPMEPAGDNVTDIAPKFLPVACRVDRR
jgi:hypothetical protein